MAKLKSIKRSVCRNDGGFTDRSLAGGLFLIGLLGHFESGGDHIVGVGIAVDLRGELLYDGLARLDDLVAVIDKIDVLLAAEGEPRNHGEKAYALCADKRGGASAAGSGSIGGNELKIIGYCHFGEFHFTMFPFLITIFARLEPMR